MFGKKKKASKRERELEEKVRELETALAKESPASAALKAAVVIIGVGVVTGITLVIGMNKIMKDIFVNEEWPGEEWSSDDWAGEDLDE
ncbi:MAG: hypothetical protein IIY88_06270 [Eubacterium sp.]|nr:hypothetical protein [Eubacterium sp.]